MISLDEKVAVVTGAGRGIGRSRARALVAHGAPVVVHDLGGDWDGRDADPRPVQQVVDEIVAHGGEACANHANVAEMAGVDGLVQQAFDMYGRLDILMNNAGILRDWMVVNMSDEDWDAVVAVYVPGHLAPTRAACWHWRHESRASGSGAGGRVVSTSSESGLYGNAGQTNCAAAKSAIASFALAVGRETNRYGVTSNFIAPRTRSRMTEKTFDEIPEDAVFDWWDPANVSVLVSHIASDVASHMNDETFVVGGGVLQLLRSVEPVWDLELSEGLGPEGIEPQLRRAFAHVSSTPGAIPDLGLTVAR